MKKENKRDRLYKHAFKWLINILWVQIALCVWQNWNKVNLQNSLTPMYGIWIRTDKITEQSTEIISKSVVRTRSFLKGPVIIYQLGGGGGLGNYLVNPSFPRRPPCQIFISKSITSQQQTICNADHPPPPTALPIAQPTNHYTSYSKRLSKCY